MQGEGPPDEERRAGAGEGGEGGDAGSDERALDPADLAACVRVLRALNGRRARVLRESDEAGAALALVSQLAARIHLERRAQRRERRREHVAADRALLEQCVLRARGRDGEAASGQAASTPTPASDALVSAASDARVLHRARRCYCCKAPFRELHFFYDSLCPACAALNYRKREQSADLRGRVALVTGARLKIGYHVALKLLRAGAFVVATTRFPHDAARRYAREPDFESFRTRLHVHGVDLRALPAVERFADAVAAHYPRLDVLVHNAAQTVRRPRAFYAPLLPFESLPLDALPPPVAALLAATPALAPHGALAPQHEIGNLDAWRESRRENGNLDPWGELRREIGSFTPGGDLAHIPRAPPALSAALSQLALDPADERYGAEYFPAHTDDGHGQPIDLRERNSWNLRLDEVTLAELLEVHAVNALAPFVLTARLRPLLLRSPAAARFVVNVSAVEGQFGARNKTAAHPHTNMAKAALNMLTRTVAARYAREGIYVNSVDTGWITNEHPRPRARAMAEGGFVPPLDVVDGAARVCDPVFAALNGEAARAGEFLKDYSSAPW